MRRELKDDPPDSNISEDQESHEERIESLSTMRYLPLVPVLMNLMRRELKASPHHLISIIDTLQNLMRRELKVPSSPSIRLEGWESHEERIESWNVAPRS